MNVSLSQVTINAARSTVWAAVTDPVLVKRWQYGSDLVTEWRVGGSIRFSSEYEGRTLEQWGTVLEFEAPHRLQYSLFAPRPGLDDVAQNYFTMTYELDDADGATVLTITQEDPREGDVAEPNAHEENPVMVELKSLVEALEADATP